MNAFVLIRTRSSLLANTLFSHSIQLIQNPKYVEYSLLIMDIVHVYFETTKIAVCRSQSFLSTIWVEYITLCSKSTVLRQWNWGDKVNYTQKNESGLYSIQLDVHRRNYRVRRTTQGKICDLPYPADLCIENMDKIEEMNECNVIMSSVRIWGINLRTYTK